VSSFPPRRVSCLYVTGIFIVASFVYVNSCLHAVLSRKKSPVVPGNGLGAGHGYRGRHHGLRVEMLWLQHLIVPRSDFSAFLGFQRSNRPRMKNEGSWYSFVIFWNQPYRLNRKRWGGLISKDHFLFVCFKKWRISAWNPCLPGVWWSLWSWVRQCSSV
jgi:hypothetical protein